MQAYVNGVGQRKIVVHQEKKNQVLGEFADWGIRWAVLSEDGGMSFHLLTHETKEFPYTAYKTALWIEAGALAL